MTIYSVGSEGNFEEINTDINCCNGCGLMQSRYRGIYPPYIQICEEGIES